MTGGNDEGERGHQGEKWNEKLFDFLSSFSFLKSQVIPSVSLTHRSHFNIYFLPLSVYFYSTFTDFYSGRAVKQPEKEKRAQPLIFFVISVLISVLVFYLVFFCYDYFYYCASF